LSTESRWLRFLSPKPALTEAELTWMTRVDGVTHEALAAVDPSDDSIAGVVRYVQHRGRPQVADVAIEVADDRQGRGIGTALADALLVRARERGLERLTATMLWENGRARGLARRLGFRPSGGAGREIELELALAGPCRPAC
jgi:RimJ/RimL family protein N-acetyltransferase